MAPRAYWKGYLKLSLVTVGVELYSAVSSSNRLRLHQIHEPSGKRVRYQKVAPGVGPVDTDEIDPRYFERPYYAVPADSKVAQEGFIVIRDALRKSGKVGLGQLAVRGRDHICAIRPCGVGLLMETLRYPEEVRESDDIFGAIEDRKVDKEC